jgi:serine/threonine-protein kinase
MSDVYQGQILAGKYRVDQVLGQGGMGVVVAATHLQLEERVALKFLLPQSLRNPEVVARFAREARAAVKIKGEHVARVIDVGTFESGAPYLVMEYLEGRDLALVVRERGALPYEDAVDAVLQACEALAEAHTLGIIHRDLKPANLFLTRRPDGTTSVKVLDFGISKLINPSGSDHSMTRTSTVMGSPLYMSPEQMTSARNVDVRSDIWGVGAILYEVLTGRVPFSAPSLPEICAQILTMTPRPVRDFNPGVPEPLQNITLRCLEKDPARRYQSVGELAQALTPFGSRATSRSHERISRILGGGLAQSGVDLPPSSVMVPSELPTTATSQATQANFGRTTSPRSATIPLIVGTALALMLLGGGATYLVMRPKAPLSVATSSGAAAPPIPARASVAAVNDVAIERDNAASPAPQASTSTNKPSAAAPSATPALAPTPLSTTVKPKAVGSVAQGAAAQKTAVSLVPAAPLPAVSTKKTREQLLDGRR